ncbi:MAG: RimK family alpha-L-glutamate ligase [Candidatus Nanohaloarchaea archaeon]|nr:RimK family alpha-L-glutamate ligase [Candidatus Nanohaloarchaea archaeon]
MKCAVVYGSESTQHQYFIESGKEYFDTVLGVPLENLRIEYGGRTRVMYKDTDLTDFDCVFFRLFGDDLLFGEHLPEILKEEGVYIPLDVDSLAISSNKFYTTKVLGNGGLPIPDSAYTLSTEQTRKAAEELGYPVVIKIIRGYGGKGVMMAEDESDLAPITDTLTLFEQDICLQDFVENPGEDVRIVVIGDETYSYKRVGEEGEFRSNISAGGDKEEYDASEEVREAAVQAAKLCGFDFCGVDVIESDEGFHFAEINETPGFDAAKEVLDIDPYDATMAFLKQKSVERESEQGL